MEFGGYVEPPSHLQRKAANGQQAEVNPNATPDYDFSLFRYSKLAVPFLLLILVTAVVLAGLTFWQGPYGLRRASNGAQDGTPRTFRVKDAETEGGLEMELRNLRIANFCLGGFGLLLAIFGIRAEPAPNTLRLVLLLAALMFFALFITSGISFGVAIDQENRAVECTDFRYFTTGGVVDSISECESRESLAHAGIAADGCQSLTALILCITIAFTTVVKGNWAWGAGNIPIAKSVNQPTTDLDKQDNTGIPTPLARAEARRTMVWMAVFALLAAWFVAAIVTALLHENRESHTTVDARNKANMIPGWPIKNNRLRIALSAIAMGLVFFNLLDYFAWKRRFVTYILATLYFFLAVGLLIVFAMDVKKLDDTRDEDTNPCPSISFGANTLECSYWQYYGTCFVEFALALIVLIYFLFEFVYRSNATVSTYFFYAESEWLRKESFFVESTDREANDWRKFILDGGRIYYYSPTLGMSTVQPPPNYVDNEAGF